MPTTTVRISRETQQLLRILASTNGESIQAVLEKAVSDYRRRTMLEEGNRAYSRLRADPKAWADELKERRAWESTLADGLQGNE